MIFDLVIEASTVILYVAIFPPLQGVGKTTLIMRVFEALKASHPSLKFQGFYSRTRSLFLSLSLVNWVYCLYEM